MFDVFFVNLIFKFFLKIAYLKWLGVIVKNYREILYRCKLQIKSISNLSLFNLILTTFLFSAPRPSGRRSRKPGVDRKPRQAYSAKQLERLEAEFKVSITILCQFALI